MAKKKDKTKEAIRSLLDGDDREAQMHLFKVSDSPLRRSIFEYNDSASSEAGTGSEDSDTSDSKDRTS